MPPILYALGLIVCSLASFAAASDGPRIMVNLEVTQEKVPCGHSPEFIISVTNLSGPPVRVLNIAHDPSTSMKVYHLDSMQEATRMVPILDYGFLEDDYYTELEEHDSIQLRVPTEDKGFHHLPPGKYLVYAKYVPDPFSQHSRDAYESNKITYEVVDSQDCAFFLFAFAEVSDDPSIRVDLRLYKDRMACGAVPGLTLSVTNLTDSPVKVLNIVSRELQRAATRIRVYHNDGVLQGASAGSPNYSTDPGFPSVDDSDYMELKGDDSIQFGLLVQDLGFNLLPSGKYLVYARYVTDPFSPFPRDVYESSRIEYEVVDSPKCAVDEISKHLLKVP